MIAVRARSRLVPLIALLALAGLLATTQLITAFAATPAPRVAFVARSDNPVDALAAGAVAAQVGGVVLLTAQTHLEQAAEDGLAAYGPDLVILAGGTAALSQQVESDIEGLGYQKERISGTTRTHTAQLLAERLETLDKAYLAVDGTAANSEKLQGRTGSELTRAASFETDDLMLQPANTNRMEAGEVEITAPNPGWLIIHAGTAMHRPTSATAQCHLRFDDEMVVGSTRWERIENTIASCQTAARIQVQSGTHTVSLAVTAPEHQANDPNAILRLAARSIVVSYVPFDGQGANPPPDNQTS